MKTGKTITILAWRDIWHPERGGAETYIDEVAKHYVSKGHKVNFLTARYKGSEENEERNGINYYRKGGRFSIYFLLPWLFLSKFKKQTDLLVENYNAFPFMAPLLLKNNLTIIHHIQTVEYELAFGTITGHFVYFGVVTLLKLFYRNKSIVTVSNTSKEYLIKKGIIPKEPTIIHPGIYTEIKMGKKPKNKINLLYLGRLKKTKGPDKAVLLLDKLVKSKQFKNIHLHIGGGGEEETALKALVKKLKLQKHVTFYGFVSEDLKYRLFNSAHLHILLSENEGWGITVIEAAAKGTPTLGYNATGLKESISAVGGYLYNTFEGAEAAIIEIAKGIQSNSQEYKNLQKGNLENAEKYTWKAQLKKLDGLGI